ncbi:LysR family transcriptional regulator [Allopusillimonas soli]|uniref:LysR family transcriptional regulator n=1 Tax=Allopusillimonas soli TaxID=659016 RepID=A0A853F6D3_9BURK|nr:LysR family transcriptional regulator [Allopusillimonas soli]NYT36125.1 LysR family transcriptional regulator [Allopusillimonas soli]TEA76460.1 LysR family transcriptional regulator [Allopusillimonas soli]
MELRQLRYFVEAARHRSISKAARALYIVQPALTAQIKALEDELGTVLLIRSTRGVTLTETGALTYRDAVGILEAAERMKSRHAKQKPPIPRAIRVGIPNGMTHAFTAQLIDRSLSTLGVHVEIVEGMSGFLLELLSKRRIDIGVLFAAQPLKGFDIAPLAVEALGLVGPPGDLDPGKPKDFAALANLPLILTSDRHGLGKVIHAHARRTHTALNVHAVVDSVTEIKRLVAMGIGYTILAPLVYAEEVEHGILSATSLRKPALMRQLVTAKWRSNPRDEDVAHIRKLIHDIRFDPSCPP